VIGMMRRQISAGLCCHAGGEATSGAGRWHPSTATAVSLGGMIKPARGHRPRGWSRMVAATAPQNRSRPTASGRPSRQSGPPWPHREKLPENHRALSLVSASIGPRPSHGVFFSTSSSLLRLWAGVGTRRSRSHSGGGVLAPCCFSAPRPTRPCSRRVGSLFRFRSKSACRSGPPGDSAAATAAAEPATDPALADANAQQLGQLPCRLDLPEAPDFLLHIVTVLK